MKDAYFGYFNLVQNVDATGYLRYFCSSPLHLNMYGLKTIMKSVRYYVTSNIYDLRQEKI